MSDALQKAEAAVKAAETDTVAVQLALAAVELAKTAAAQQQASRQEVCQHQHKEPVNVGEKPEKPDNRLFALPTRGDDESLGAYTARVNAAADAANQGPWS